MTDTLTTLDINQIIADPQCQPRAGMWPELVQEYAEAMRNGSTFPPVTVFTDGEWHWLADGFHRLDAALSIGRTQIDAEIRPGTKRDAILHAVGANAAHGMRRTNNDKRRAVETLLKDAEWQKWSDREIARQCDVSQPFVSSVRKYLSDNGYQMEGPRFATRNGTTYEVNTSNIGKQREANEPPPFEEVDPTDPATFLEPMKPTPTAQTAPDLMVSKETRAALDRHFANMAADLLPLDLSQKALKVSAYVKGHQSALAKLPIEFRKEAIEKNPKMRQDYEHLRDDMVELLAVIREMLNDQTPIRRIS